MNKQNNWLGRSLANYKSMHQRTATDARVLDKFNAAPTLTQARVILFGAKAKAFSCCTAGCGYKHCPRAQKK